MSQNHAIIGLFLILEKFQLFNDAFNNRVKYFMLSNLQSRARDGDYRIMHVNLVPELKRD